MDSRATLTLSNMPRSHRTTLVAATLICAAGLGWMPTLHYAPAAVYALGVWRLALTVVLTVASVTILHECLHGLFFRLFGGRVSFGARMSRLGPVAWTTSTGHYTKRQYQAISLAPQLLTLAVLLVAALAHDLSPAVKMMLSLAGVINLCGGGADIYGLWWLRRTPDNCLIEDIKDGISVSTAKGRRV